RRHTRFSRDWSSDVCSSDLEAAVDLDIALVIDPWHPEDDLPFRLADPLDQRMFDIGGMFGHNPPEAFEHFADGLMELGFAGIARSEERRVGKECCARRGADG